MLLNSNNLANHLPEAVKIMLPPLTSFPLDEFVLSIAAEACFMARKQLENKKWSTSLTERKLRVRECIDAHDVHKGIHRSVCQCISRGDTRLITSHISKYEASQRKVVTLAKNTSNLPSSRRASSHTPEIVVSSAASAC